jgi:hypothetical protein
VVLVKNGDEFLDRFFLLKIGNNMNSVLLLEGMQFASEHFYTQPARFKKTSTVQLFLCYSTLVSVGLLSEQAGPGLDRLQVPGSLASLAPAAGTGSSMPNALRTSASWT